MILLGIYQNLHKLSRASDRRNGDLIDPRSSSLKKSLAKNSKPHPNPRLADLILKSIEGEVVFLVYPYDLGVEINADRIGAAKGPKAFRPLLDQIGTVDNPEIGIIMESLTFSEAGNLPKNLTLEELHLNLNQTAGILSVEKKTIVDVVTGGKSIAG